MSCETNHFKIPQQFFDKNSRKRLISRPVLDIILITVQETFYNFATTSHHTLLLTFQSGKNFSSH
jgi:hypothetical protein